MKPYARDHEPSNVRSVPDASDVRALGLSSKHGKTRAKGKAVTRRYWKRVARAAAKRALAVVSAAN